MEIFIRKRSDEKNDEKKNKRRVKAYSTSNIDTANNIQTSSISLHLSRKRIDMEEILHKFINEGKREHEEMRAFINDFKTTNEILLKERDNSLIEL
ncbi:hypothetical protein Tco_0812215, partial [Tanacetum coccineum]